MVKYFTLLIEVLVRRYSNLVEGIVSTCRRALEFAGISILGSDVKEWTPLFFQSFALPPPVDGRTTRSKKKNKEAIVYPLNDANGMHSSAPRSLPCPDTDSILQPADVSTTADLQSIVIFAGGATTMN